jgi:uncharacterized protein (UPF0332 family)
MNKGKDNNIKEIIKYWVEKSVESLSAAEDELKAGRLSFSVNRIYYSCFYIVSALLLKRELKFKKHSGVRAAFHGHFVKPGLISREYGQFYDEIFEARQRGDYIELVRFKKEQVEKWFQRAKDFVYMIRRLIE